MQGRALESGLRIFGKNIPIRVEVRLDVLELPQKGLQLSWVERLQSGFHEQSIQQCREADLARLLAPRGRKMHEADTGRAVRCLMVRLCGS